MKVFQWRRQTIKIMMAALQFSLGKDYAPINVRPRVGKGGGGLGN